MVTIKTQMGRSLTVTADHPVIRHNAYGYDVIAASEVTVSDQLMTLNERPIDHAPFQKVPLDYSVVNVVSVKHTFVQTTVYSLETATNTVIVSSGLIAHNCFPKDVKALAHMADINGKHPELLNTVMEINTDQRVRIVEKLQELLGDLNGKVIGSLGLAFKENTDDLRESPAMYIAEILNQHGAIVRGYDPVAMENVMRTVPYIHLAEDSYDLARGCDALVIATPWNEFKQLDMTRMRDAMKQPIMVDGRNLYDPELMRSLGFTYLGVGRGYKGNGHSQIIDSEIDGIQNGK